MCVANIVSNGHLLGKVSVTPATNRAIWFIAHNTDGTTSDAQLLIKTNGDLVVLITVDSSMNAPVINGSCYLG